MKVTQEKLPASQLGLEIEIAPEMSKQVYDKKVRDYARTANIPGFRKGKVPRQVLIQRLGANRIKMAVLEELIDTSVRQAIDQEKISALGNFQLRSSFEDLTEQFEPGKPFTFSASVDVPPDVTLQDYSGLSLKAEEVTYDASKVDDVLEDYRNRVATLVPVEDRSIQIGDIAIINFSGTYVPSEGEDPVEIPGGSAQDFQLEMKEGQFIEGFVKGIVGMNAGESRELNLTFPADYPKEELAGKPAVFSITLTEIKEKELPDLDDDFAQEVSEFETLEELRDTLEKRFQSEAEQKTKKNKTTAILNELIKHIEVDLPASMIMQEVDFLVSQAVSQLENRGLEVRKILNKELLEGMRERSRPEAEARLKRTLALGEIAKKESIEVGGDELEAKVAEFMQSYQDQNVDPQRVREVLKDELLEERVLEWIEENSTIELVPEGTLAVDTEEANTATESTDASEGSAKAAEAPGDSSALDAQSEQDAEASTDMTLGEPMSADAATVDVAATPVEEPEAQAAEESSTGKKAASKKSSKGEPASELTQDEVSTDESVDESVAAEETAPTKKTTRGSKTTKAKKSSKKSDDSDSQSDEISDS